MTIQASTKIIVEISRLRRSFCCQYSQRNQSLSGFGTAIAIEYGINDAKRRMMLP